MDPFILKTNERLVAWRDAVDETKMHKDTSYPDAKVYIETWSPSRGWARGRVVTSFSGRFGLDKAKDFVASALKKEDPWWNPQFFTSHKAYPSHPGPKYTTAWKKKSS